MVSSAYSSIFKHTVQLLSMSPAHKKIVLTIAAILGVGLGLRLYHFSDWLHFEVDQSRDFRVVNEALQNGPGELPLLGPRAAGTFLRLGPGFYNLSYLSVLIFGDTPPGMAMASVVLSTASILSFFLLLRRLFRQRLALLLTLLFATSLFFVLYGRFAWNPNTIPFFLITGFYLLLRALDGRNETTTERNITRFSRREWFFVTAATCLAFATQLHFLVFVSVPIITAIFLAFHRPHLRWRGWLAAIGVIALLYVPVILNDIVAHGANAREFLQAVGGKSSKEGHTLVENFAENVTNQSLLSWIIVTGYEGAELPNVKSVGTMLVDIKCDGGCRAHLLGGAFAGTLWVLGIVSFIWFFRKERDRAKRDTFSLLAIWFSVCFILFLPLAADFAPRFFLILAPFPFVSLGFVTLACSEFLPARFGMKTGYLIVICMIVSNIFFVSQRFSELSRARSENFETAPDRILKEKTRFTLEQQNDILDWMVSFQDKNGEPLYFYSEPEYRRALRTILEARGRTELDVQRFYNGSIYQLGNYFVFLRTGSNIETGLARFREKFDEVESKSFGTITGFRFTPKPEFITAETRSFEPSPGRTEAPGVAPRYTWQEWWNRSPGETDDEADAEE